MARETWLDPSTKFNQVRPVDPRQEETWLATSTPLRGVERIAQPSFSKPGSRAQPSKKREAELLDERVLPQLTQILRSMGWDIDTAGHLTPAKEENHGDN